MSRAKESILSVWLLQNELNVTAVLVAVYSDVLKRLSCDTGDLPLTKGDNYLLYSDVLKE